MTILNTTKKKKKIEGGREHEGTGHTNNVKFTPPPMSFGFLFFRRSLLLSLQCFSSLGLFFTMVSAGIVASCLALLAPARGFVSPIVTRTPGAEVRVLSC